MTNRTLSREFGPMIRLLPDQFSQNTLLPDERVESIFAHETSTQNQPRHDQMTERERYRPTKTRTMMTMIVVAIACSLLKWIGKSFWKTGTQAHKHSVSQWISWRLNECIKLNGFSSYHPTVLWIYISESSITETQVMKGFCVYVLIAESLCSTWNRVFTQIWNKIPLNTWLILYMI